uniref:Superoxide dismutase copper/zinc binding domain-containing protein n=1 Tax=Leptobrachium leishanense TaxID=445787 RepID=A0A8C5QAW0_9ANUR
MALHFPILSCRTYLHYARNEFGRVMFRQPVLSSVSGITSLGHNWHVHELPLQTEADSCTSAGSHFNPFNVPTGGSYNQECGSHNPLLCETGDYANSTVRYFFTDTSSSLAGPTSIIGKSLVIHVANGGAMLAVCVCGVSDTSLHVL